MQLLVVVVALALASSHVEGLLGYPEPIVTFRLSPELGTPTAPPAMVSVSAAFLSYQNGAGVSKLVYTDPLQPTVLFPTSLVNGFYLTLPPTIINATAVIVEAQYPETMVAVVTSTGLYWQITRRQATASVLFIASLNLVIVPYGVGGTETLLALSTTSNNLATVWINAYTTQVNFTTVGTPLYFGGFIYVLAGKGVRQLYPNNGSSVNAAPWDPCGITAPLGQILTLRTVTYGQSLLGPTSALLVYGNSSFKGYTVFQICSMNPANGQRVWLTQIFGDYTVNSISGGNNMIFLSLTAMAYNNGAPEAQLVGIDALRGGLTWSSPRSVRDARSAPTFMFMPSAVAAAAPNGIVIAQINGSTLALDAYSGNRVWAAPFPCQLPPAPVFVLGYVACVYPGNSLVMLDISDGAVVWATNAIQPVFAPIIVDGTNVVVVTLNNTLLGLSATVPAPASGGSSGTPPGVTGGIVLGVLLLVGIIVAAALYYNFRVRVAWRSAAASDSGYQGIQM